MDKSWGKASQALVLSGQIVDRQEALDAVIICYQNSSSTRCLFDKLGRNIASVLIFADINTGMFFGTFNA